MPSKSPSHRINRYSTRSSPCSQPDSPVTLGSRPDSIYPGIELDKSRGANIDPTKTRVTISDWMDVWVAARLDLRATSRTRAIGIINTHIRPRLGPIQIGQFTRLQAQLWAAGIPGSPETVRKFVNVLSGALQLAVDDGRLPANPAQRSTLPKRIKAAKRYVRHDQVSALAVGSRPHRRELGCGTILHVPYCGLRWDELSGLRLRDLNLPAPVSR